MVQSFEPRIRAESDLGTYASCGSCASTFTERAWRALPLAETLTATAVSAYAVGWPTRLTIEVRSCSGCGRSLARSTLGREPLDR